MYVDGKCQQVPMNDFTIALLKLIQSDSNIKTGIVTLLHAIQLVDVLQLQDWVDRLPTQLQVSHGLRW